MSDSLTIEDQEVEFGFDSAQRRENCRAFAETEQAGDVGKRHRSARDPFFDHHCFGNIPHDHRCQTVGSIARECTVDAGHELHRMRGTGPIDLIREFSLKGDRLAGIDLPTMRSCSKSV